ncbi:predicted protein [Uncinocarpus reesii 1704]|uniref:Uncharacterized protein n=1 Tax=Uncinocarpus reesii (strain UAMH 1704) TaxID=336963 RepID=C4JGD7_UNCRE|nr:uncharacterized protein UREG_01128 [Uncinocarpus reesii 1704]EEP76279.1 predicted protein [Uncinocarpus reesii 1704]
MNEEEEEQEFEFRLFRSTAPDALGGEKQDGPIDTGGGIEKEETRNVPAVHKIRVKLRSPSPSRSAEGGFTVPFRAWDYYFSDPELVMRVFKERFGKSPSGACEFISKDPKKQERRQNYLEVAVTSDQVLAAANSGVWPGCHLPWRVIHFAAPFSKTSKVPSQTPLSTTDPSLKPKKKKPGKKRRIMLRNRVAAKAAAEEADREKRTRRNREKKIKRRQREREKKTALQTVEHGTGVDLSESMSLSGNDK